MLRKLQVLLEKLRDDNRRRSVSRKSADVSLYDVGFTDGIENGLIQAQEKIKQLIEDEKGLEDDGVD